MFFWAQRFQPGCLSGPMRRELERGLTRPGSPNVARVLELAGPDGVTYRWSDAGVPRPDGQYVARVLQWGTIGDGVDLSSASFGARELTTEIADVDRTFSTLAARYRKTLRGAAVTVRLVSPHVSALDSATLFSGRLLNWQQASPMRWALRFGPQDSKIQVGTTPDLAITTTLFGRAAEAARGFYVPIPYGIHNSQGLSSQGALAAYLIDSIAWEYVVCRGVTEILAVYEDGTLLPTADYTVSYPVYAGRVFTAVTFSIDKATATITADVSGLTDVGDGTGETILNPALQARHFLTNFVFNAWGQGSYLAPSASLLDLRSFADAAAFFVDHRGYRSSLIVGGSEQAEQVADVLTRFAGSFGMSFGWTAEGRVALRILDYRPPADVYAEEQAINATDDSDIFATPIDDSKTINSVRAQYARLAIDGRLYNELPVGEHVPPDERVAEPLSLHDFHNSAYDI